jgi:hypothetical protein
VNQREWLSLWPHTGLSPAPHKIIGQASAWNNPRSGRVRRQGLEPRTRGLRAPATPTTDGEGPSGSGTVTEAKRLMAIEQRLLRAIQWVVFGGVILLTVGAGALSWEHLTHIAAANGHIAPRHLLFLFPIIEVNTVAFRFAVGAQALRRRI